MDDTMRDLLSKLETIRAEKQDLLTAEDPVPEDVSSEDHETVEEDLYQIGDEFGISLSDDLEISTEIIGLAEDGVVISLDEYSLDWLSEQGMSFLESELTEDKIKGADGKACWKGYRYAGTKHGKDRCVKVGEDEDLDERSFPFAGKKVGHKEGPAGQLKGKMKRPVRPGDLVGGTESIDNDVEEAKYQGREVPLGKPMKGDVKKSKVYVKKPNGNIVKVNFGDKKMRIKKSNPKRRKSFRARHHCANPGPRWKARYWSCRSW